MNGNDSGEFRFSRLSYARHYFEPQQIVKESQLCFESQLVTTERGEKESSHKFISSTEH